LLTPRGIEQKARLTVQFLQAKMIEYEILRSEIRQMRREVKGLTVDTVAGRRCTNAKDSV
jgi:hypothetical protein